MENNRVASFFKQSENNNVQCFLCPHNCVIKPEKYGLCSARKNIGGTLYSMNYGKITSLGLDPIEKKPIKMFKQGSYILSVGTYGCNFKCSFCQNWSIAHEKPHTIDVNPIELVEKALETELEGNIGIAYTYNEPTIWYEYILDTARIARDNNLINVLVTNGYISKEPLNNLLKYIDAMNIDVKAFNEDFYSKYCKGNLIDVKNTVELSAKKCHIEITTLIIPGLNDEEDEIRMLSEWIQSISEDIPLHLSRFFPNYKMRDRQITSPQKIYKLRNIASEYLKHVFVGNI